MKIIKLFLLGVLMISVSCISDAENFGPSECSVTFTNRINGWEDGFQDLMGQPDSEGNHQSLEVCLNRRGHTQEYILILESEKIRVNSQDGDGCSSDERNDINSRIDDRTQELEEDLMTVWNDCEDIYGGG